MEDQSTFDFDLDNFRDAEPNILFSAMDRPHGADKNTAVRMYIAVPGKKDPKPFSAALKGADFSRIITDSYGDDLMFVSWADDNPVLPLIKDFSAWIEQQFREKVFSKLEMRLALGYNEPKYTYSAKNQNFALPFGPWLWYDEKRHCWSVFVRPTMSSGVSANGKKFSATRVIHRPTKTSPSIAAMRKLAGKGLFMNYCIEISGKTGKKRFKTSAYELHYDSVLDASDDGTEASLARAESLAPTPETTPEEQQEALDLISSALANQDSYSKDSTAGGLSVTAGDEDDENEDDEAPTPPVPFITAAAPLTTVVPLKALKK